MSDFLVNLARRSAGLAPVVRARSAPVFMSPDPTDMSGETAVDRNVQPYSQAIPAQVVRQSASADTSPSDVVRPAPAPITVMPQIHRVAQRSPATGDAAVPAQGRIVAQPAEVAIPAVPHAEVTVASGASVAPADATATVDPRNDSREASRTEVVREVIRVIDPATDLVIEKNDNDAADPVTVSIRPVEQPVSSSQPMEAIAPEQRIVNVRIGAIEISGPDNPAQTPPPVSSVAPLQSVNGTAPGGFDDYAALRSYTPWAW